MISRTKRALDNTTIKKLFASAGIENVGEIVELGAGEFNAVYKVTADKDYVLKIAPSADTPVLEYEKNMIKAEIYWYSLIRKNTAIKVPEIYYTDFSKKLIDSDWFIMEMLEGVQRNEINTDKDFTIRKTAEMFAQIHNIKNDKYGYFQNTLYNNWYDALSSFIENLLSDAHKIGRKSKKGQKLLGYTKQYKDILINVPCCMVNYDLWDPNVICKRNQNNEIELQWIDPERSFWGDKIFDVLCMENPADMISKKSKSLSCYNKITDEPIAINREIEIRFAFALGLLALIQEVEKYYRYTPRHFGWWRNVMGSSFYYQKAFGILKNG